MYFISVYKAPLTLFNVNFLEHSLLMYIGHISANSHIASLVSWVCFMLDCEPSVHFCED